MPTIIITLCEQEWMEGIGSIWLRIGTGGGLM
jgi:hypothetical protein